MSEKISVEERFDVGLPPAELFAVVSDLEQVAPCVPGASLDPRTPDDDGRVRTGEVVFAFGPIRYRYRGTMTTEVLDEADRRVTYVAAASETSGEGDLGADLTLAVLENGTGSTLRITCDVALTGMVAEFGAGMVNDVGHDIFGQFGKAVQERYVDNRVEPQPQAPAEATTAPAEPAPSPEAPASSPPAAAAPIGGFALMLRITRSRLRRLFARLTGRSSARRTDGGAR
jgi:carbon monoxide dehydrogenase subunit G